MKRPGSHEMEKDKYVLLGLLSRCYKFKGKNRYSTAMGAERNDGMNHKRRQKRSDEAELAYLSVSCN